MKKLIFLLLIIVFSIKCNSLVESNPLHQKVISKIQNSNGIDLQKDLTELLKNEPIDFGLQYLITKLPKNVRTNYQHLITNNNIKCIQSLNENHNNFNEYEHKKLLNLLIENLDSNKLLNFERIKFESCSSNKISKPNLNYISSIDSKELSAVELFSFLDMLNFVGGRISNGNEQISNAMLFYGLHLLKVHQLSDSYLAVKGELYYAAGISFLDESEDEIAFGKKLLLEAGRIYKSTNLMSKARKCEWALGILENDPSNKLFLKLDEIEKLDLSVRERVVIATDIGVSLIDSVPKEAIAYLVFADNQLIDNSCLFYKSVVLNLLGYTYYQLGNDQKTREYFDRTNNFGNCNKFNSWDSEFYNITIQKDILPELDPNFTFQDGINLRLKQRALADSLQISTDHLGDYFAINAIEILELIDQQAKPTQEKISEVLNLVNDTKYRELKRLRSLSNKLEDSSSSTQIKSLLREIDNFKKIDDFTNPAYAKLFHLTIEDYLSREEEVEKINDQVNFKPLEKKIKNKDFQLVEFLAYNNVYAAYSYNSTGMKLTQFERGVVDSNITNLISNISRGENLDSIQTILKTQLFQDLNLDNVTPIVILPDGPLVNVPFHLLFEQDVRQHISIEDLSTEVRDTIDRNKFSLLSYTDGGTLKSKEANEYQELLEAFNECSLINAMIGGSANFLSGKGANLKGFEKALNSDLIHIASHGSTNRNNRYDNYILLRDENTAPVKMYSYEIEQQNHCPEVVILSACDTGIGAFSNGVGTYSISRAFMAAGAEAVVKSLWKVDDKSTKIFMELLYTKWLEGVSLMNAINHARQSMARDTSFTPHDWSGFVLEGNGSYYLK